MALACVECYLDDRPPIEAVAIRGAMSVCAEHDARVPAYVPRLDLVPLYGDDLAYALTDGWVR